MAEAAISCSPDAGRTAEGKPAGVVRSGRGGVSRAAHRITPFGASCRTAVAPNLLVKIPISALE